MKQFRFCKRSFLVTTSMYKEHFGFTATPFSIAPDPHSLYMSEGHKEALAHLFYGMRIDGGFVMLTGEVGTGKTTICRCLLEQVPEDTDVAFIFNPKLTVEELLATICDEFGIQHQKDQSSIKFYVDHINSFLLDSHAKGRRAVLIIDEAQNLSTDVLEQIRLLTNLETNKRKLLQIILLGQPELKNMLQQPELRQLAQRITARYHLTPLSENEVCSYVTHRLAIAGGRNRIFPESTMKPLFKLSKGTPRLINIICDRSLLGAYVQDQDSVNVSTLKKAAKEIFGESNQQPRATRISFLVMAGLFLLLGMSVLAAAYFNQTPNTFSGQTSVAQVAIIDPPLDQIEKVEALVTDPQTSTEQQEAVKEEAEVAVSQVPLSPLEWPADEPVASSVATAYTALLSTWGIDYVPEDEASACAIAESHNLRCLSRQGSFDSLLGLNRPAVLNLYDSNGQNFHAAFISYHDHVAELVLGSTHKFISVNDFKGHWNGDYSLLWEKPDGYLTAVRPENNAVNVAWLDKKLAIIQDRPASSKVPVLYDEILVSQVKQFQFEKSLVPDGIVGPQTIIHLNSAYNNRVPKLIDMAGGK